MNSTKLIAKMKKLGRFVVSRKFSSNGHEDKALQKSFGPLARLVSLLTILQPEGKKAFEKLEKDYFELPFKNLYVWKLYADLQNPLLRKYNFDYDSFHTGAQESASQYINALVSPELYEFINSSEENKKKRTTVPDCVDFIQSTSSSNFYNAVVDSFQRLNKFNLPVTMTGFRFKKAVIVSVSTDIYQDTQINHRDEKLFHGRSRVSRMLTDMFAFPRTDETPKAENEAKSPAFKVKVMVNPTDEELMQLNQFDQIKYQNGSVLATVNVIFDAEVTSKEDGQQETSRDVLLSVVFNGCISGQTELEWKVIEVRQRSKRKNEIISKDEPTSTAQNSHNENTEQNDANSDNERKNQQ